AAVLAAADLLAVKPQKEKRVYTIEGQEDAAPRPVFGNGESVAIRVDGVVRLIIGYKRRIRLGPVPRPGIADVHVDGDAVAGHLNIGWHLDIGPGVVVKTTRPEAIQPVGQIC